MKIRIVKPEFITRAGNVVYTSKEIIEIDIDKMVADWLTQNDYAMRQTGKSFSQYLQEKLK